MRLGLVVTLCCNLPLLVLPCRDTAMQLLGWAKADDADAEGDSPDGSELEDSPLLGEETPLVNGHSGNNGSNGHSHARYTLPAPPSLPASPSSSPSHPSSFFPLPSTAMVLLTLALVGSSALLSVAIESVALL